MTRTIPGIAAVLLGAAAVVGAQAPARTPAAAMPKVGQVVTYVGCVQRILGYDNFHLVNAVPAKGNASTRIALRLAVPKDIKLREYVKHKIEVTGTVGEPLPVNNAMDSVNRIDVTQF